jgi:ribonuclease HII
LAGPVVAAAFVILSSNSTAYPPSLEYGIADSKTVGESDRELLFGSISQCALQKHIEFETAVVDHSRIDAINILQATFEAMTAAAQALVKKIMFSHGKHATFSILIDGNKVCFVLQSFSGFLSHEIQQVPPALASSPYSCTSVIKGDGIEFVIAAASICAKVTRDRIMRNIHAQYPLYNFEQHKGYGTSAHVAAIFKHGPCPYHRMTFAPLKHMAIRQSVKAASHGGGKAASAQRSSTSMSKRARPQSSPSETSRGSNTAAASCPAESERTMRLRRRTERSTSG